MIPIIIADDERLDIDYLLKVVNYKELGLEVVAVCREGRELMQKIEQLDPMIVLTDIVMPEMSGLEIAHRIKESGRKTRLVFITGHQNFNYAQIAMNYTVCHYLIKPVLPEQLTSILTQLAVQCVEENRRAYAYENFQRHLEQNMPLLRDATVRQLIFGTLGDSVEEKLRFCGIPLRSEGITALILLPEYGQDDLENNRRLTYLSVKNGIDVFLGKRGISYCSMLEYESLTVLLNVPVGDDPSPAVTLAEDLHAAIATSAGVSVTIGIGQTVDGFESVPHSFACAGHALKARFLLGSGQVISYNDIADGASAGSHGIKRYRRPLCDAVYSGNDRRISLIIADIALTAAKEHQSLEYLKVYCVELFSKVTAEIYETCRLNEDSVSIANNYLDLIAADTVNELLGQLENFLIRLSKKNGLLMNDRTNRLVEAMIQIINDQYMQDLSVDAIAAQVYISAGYATRIFKKATGVGINTYITNVRMQKAMELLLQPEYKIKDVAQAVGYSNIAYFSSVFRKQYGQAPLQYRMTQVGDA